MFFMRKKTLVLTVNYGFNFLAIYEILLTSKYIGKRKYCFRAEFRFWDLGFPLTLIVYPLCQKKCFLNLVRLIGYSFSNFWRVENSLPKKREPLWYNCRNRSILRNFELKLRSFQPEFCKFQFFPHISTEWTSMPKISKIIKCDRFKLNFWFFTTKSSWNMTFFQSK